MVVRILIGKRPRGKPQQRRINKVVKDNKAIDESKNLKNSEN